MIADVGAEHGHIETAIGDRDAVEVRVEGACDSSLPDPEITIDLEDEAKTPLPLVR